MRISGSVGRAVSGYVTGGPARVHFGVPAGATVERLEIRWPDGAMSAIDAPRAQTPLIATREEPP